MAEKESIRELQQRLELEQNITDLYKENTKDIASFLSIQVKTAKLKKSQIDLENEIVKYLTIQGKIKKGISKEEREILKQLQTQSAYYKIQTALLEKQNTLGNLLKSVGNDILNTVQELAGVRIGEELSAKGILKWIIEQDKYTKQLNLSLGISGERAKSMSKSIQDTAFQTQILGVGVQQLTEIYGDLSKETGRVRLYTTQQQEAIAEISAGLKLSTQQTGQLVGMYENIGISLIGTHERMQELTDMSERYGINVSNVMDSVLKNFKKAQRFYFKGGVDSAAKMAVFAEKWKLSMESTLEFMEKGRTLEGSVEAVQMLRLAGQKFSQADPFKILYQARSDGDALQKTIAGLTEGVAFFDKKLQQFQVSAVGIDQLRIASEALGIPLEELKQTAIRVSEISMMQKSIPGFARANKEYKDLIEGQAKWNEKTKEFELTDPLHPDRIVSIRKVGREQLDMFKAGADSLRERAKQSQSFDQVMQNSINQLKSAFLPLLEGLHDWVIKPLQSISEWLGKIGSGWSIAFLVLGVPAVMGLGKALLSVIPNLISMNLQMFAMKNTMTKFSSMSKGMPKGGIISNLFGGMSFTGIAKGALMIGIMAGGLSLLGLALQQFVGIDWKTLAVAGTAIVGLTGAMFGLGLLLTGTAGIGAIIFGAGVAGFAAMGASLWVVASAMKELSESNIPNIGQGFDTIKSSVNAIDSDKLEEIRKTALALKEMSLSTGMFGGLNNLFKDGLKVEFKDKTVALNIDLTNEINGDIVARKTVSKIAQLQFEGDYYKKPT